MNKKKHLNKLDTKTITSFHLPQSMEFKANTETIKPSRFFELHRKSATALHRSCSSSIISKNSNANFVDKKSIAKPRSAIIKFRTDTQSCSSHDSNAPSLLPVSKSHASLDIPTYFVEQEHYGEDRENQLFYSNQDSNLRQIRKMNKFAATNSNLESNGYSAIIENVQNPLTISKLNVLQICVSVTCYVRYDFLTTDIQTAKLQIHWKQEYDRTWRSEWSD